MTSGTGIAHDATYRNAIVLLGPLVKLSFEAPDAVSVQQWRERRVLRRQLLQLRSSYRFLCSSYMISFHSNMVW
jgi:hypothetical protein